MDNVDRDLDVTVFALHLELMDLITVVQACSIVSPACMGNRLNMKAAIVMGNNAKLVNINKFDQ